MFLGEILISGYMLVALNSPSVFPMRNVAVEEPAILAKSAIIVDTQKERILFDKDSAQLLPAASLTKVLSALVVLDTIPLEKVITMDQRALVSGDNLDFKVGEKIQARHLLFAALIHSSNAAMMALAYDIGLDNFLSLMRSKTIELGVQKAVIDDPVGLSPKTRISSAEYAKIAQAGFTNNFINNVLSIPEYTFKSVSGRSHKLVSTNPLIFDARIVAAKTGTLREIGENFAALVKDGTGQARFVAVVIGSTDRAKDMTLLINWLDKGFIWM